MILRVILAAACLATAGCTVLPNDPDGTLDRVRAERLFRVGLISSGGLRSPSAEEARFLRRVAAATQAHAALREGAADRLMAGLQDGSLDLVIGELAPATPWMTEVAVLMPIGERIDRKGHMLVAPAAKNGENAWIMLLEREARAVAAELSPR
jgi:hypothetical protein